MVEDSLFVHAFLRSGRNSAALSLQIHHELDVTWMREKSLPRVEVTVSSAAASLSGQCSQDSLEAKQRVTEKEICGAWNYTAKALESIVNGGISDSVAAAVETARKYRFSQITGPIFTQPDSDNGAKWRTP